MCIRDRVIIRTTYPGQAPQIVENQVTYPLATTMLSVPGAKTVRGYSMFGDSYVYILFADDTDLYWARSRVLEYLNQVQSRLPADAKPSLGPDATGVGWVYEYALVDKSGTRDLSQLRALQDWFLKYELKTVTNAVSYTHLDVYKRQVPELDERILALEEEGEMRRAELARWISTDAERPLAAMPTDRDLGHAPESLLAAVPLHAPLAPVLAKIAAAQTDVELARAQTRPDWSAEFDYEQRGPDFSNMVSLEFHIALPLFPKNRQNPVIAEKLALVRAKEAERDAEVRMHTAEIRSELAQWRQGRERLKNYATELLPLARDRSRAAIASYGAGRGALRVAIDALTQEINTQLEYVQLEGSVASAWAALHFLHDSGISQ